MTSGITKQRIVRNAPVAAADFTSHFLQARGLLLHYLDYGTAGHTPMLCVHGGGAHAHWFDFVARGFIADYHVRSLDLRGHGDSAWMEDGDYSAELFAQDIAEVAERLDLRGFVLIGHSMGGMIALVYAATRPARLGKLVVVDSAMRVTPERMATLRNIGARGGRAYATREELIARYRLLPAGTAAARETIRHVAYHSGQQGHDGQWRHKFDRNVYTTRRAMDGYAQLERVQVPALIVKGALSDRYTTEIEVEIKRRCPHVEIAEVRDSYHHVTIDNPTGFIDAVQRFLRTSG